MTYDANNEAPRAGEQTSRAGERDGSDKRAVERVANWAWSSACGPYDWMDSHAPFPELD